MMFNFDVRSFRWSHIAVLVSALIAHDGTVSPQVGSTPQLGLLT